MRLLEQLWRTGWPPLEWITGPVDIFFEPNFFLPPLGRAKAVVTVHDLSFQRYPKWFPNGVAKRRVRQLRKTLDRADAVIAVTNFTANEIRRFWPQYEDKVQVIHEAPGPEFQSQSPQKIQEIVNRLGLHDPFILYVGALEHRKNVTSLVRAFLQLKEAGGTECQLVLAGTLGHGSKEIMSLASDGLRRRWIRFLGFIKQEDLPALYCASRLFCCLSWYEGFGLPPLEALACGTPVIVSRIPVFQEILGPHARYVNPSDIVNISRVIAECEESAPSSAKDRSLWASKFSWHKATQQTYELFQRVI